MPSEQEKPGPEDEADGQGVRCDFCGEVVDRVRRIALDGDYERLRTPHQVQYACELCSVRKDVERVIGEGAGVYLDTLAKFGKGVGQNQTDWTGKSILASLPYLALFGLCTLSTMFHKRNVDKIVLFPRLVYKQ